MEYKLQYKRYSENAILIEWPSEIDENLHQNLLCFKKTIETELIEVIVEVISGYNSLLIIYHTSINNIYDKISLLESLYLSNAVDDKEGNVLWEIPVCYSPTLAQDLEQFSKMKSMTIEEVISLHAATRYRVYFIGFLPGFLYLGGLDKKLHLPRKESPSLNIRKGSVAIGGNQTGIYPMNSPGGWHVIGKSPVSFFDVNNDVPCFAEPGDMIQFISIEIEEYNDISSRVIDGDYQLQPVVL